MQFVELFISFASLVGGCQGGWVDGRILGHLGVGDAKWGEDVHQECPLVVGKVRVGKGTVVA